MVVRKQRRLLDLWLYMTVLAASCMPDRQLMISSVNHDWCTDKTVFVLPVFAGNEVIKQDFMITPNNCLHLPSSKNKCLGAPLSILDGHNCFPLTAESCLSIKLLFQITVLPQTIT